MNRNLPCTLLLLAGLSMAGAGIAGGLPAGYSEDEALQYGERIYRQGIKPDGSPIQAVVSQNVPIDGTMVTCVSCHQRSGLGSLEGNTIAWPISGKELFQERRRTGAWNPNAPEHSSGIEARRELPQAFQVSSARPAYTEETLATLLRTGIDPTGRRVESVMPRFVLDDTEMQLLIHYLKNLSSEQNYSPGVTAETLRFATVITDGVSQVDRDSMLEVLKAHIRARNTQTRPHKRRLTSGPFYKTELFSAYRTLELDVWELHGEPETWEAQLQDYYDRAPVFALLGGISNDSWEPIHRFSERMGLPSILPITDRPVVNQDDWYTLYFSKGRYQEGETAADFVRERFETAGYNKVVQLFEGTDMQLFVDGFNARYKGAASLTTIDTSRTLDSAQAEVLAGIDQQTVLLYWGEGESGLALLDALAEGGLSGIPVIVSNRLFTDELSVPLTLRDNLFMMRPHSLPQEHRQRETIVKRWLEREGIAPGNFEIQSKMYFLGWMLPGALRHMRSEFYRDYFMEGFDMMSDQNIAIAVYPRLSFASGQRYLAKGCYVTQLEAEEIPRLVKVSDWVDY